MIPSPPRGPRKLVMIVCGDREWGDFDVIYDVLKQERPELIIEGEAVGADILARQAGEMLGITVDPYFASWNRFGKAAGPIRNQEMLNALIASSAKEKIILGFHDTFASSRGTKDMFARGKKAGIDRYLVRHGGNPGTWTKEKYD